MERPHNFVPPITGLDGRLPPETMMSNGKTLREIWAESPSPYEVAARTVAEKAPTPTRDLEREVSTAAAARAIAEEVVVLPPAEPEIATDPVVPPDATEALPAPIGSAPPGVPLLPLVFKEAANA